MKVLLAVDGSGHSARATSALIKYALSHSTKPDVILMFVHLPVPRVPHLAKFVSREMMDRYYREEGEKALARCQRLLRKAGLPFESRIRVGKVADTIVDEAHKAKCDAIYIGTRGLGAVGSLVLGSTATKVLHLATVPVTLVK
jgi:nucleotide-binding universal stress UspA family protein